MARTSSFTAASAAAAPPAPLPAPHPGAPVVRQRPMGEVSAYEPHPGAPVVRQRPMDDAIDASAEPRAARWTMAHVGWPAAIFSLALLVRLLHVLTHAKVLLADDAVFFEQHAKQFLVAWHAFGSPAFWPALKQAIDDASLQGIVFPWFESLVYLVTGGVHHQALILVQALLGAGMALLTYLAAERAFGRTAGLVAGSFAALYPPLILVSGLLLAEALLLFVQALALWWLVRGLTPGAWRARVLGGIATGVLMLRPAFQYAGPLLLVALLAAGWLACSPPSAFERRLRAALAIAAPFLAGVLLIAVPWVLLNGRVYGQFTWSRTGDAWQQVYWGIYPPNHGWWPPDSPVPPKYGVESLPGAISAGQHIEVHDLDYLDAAINQVRATPLKAAATEVNKLYQAYLHPFDPYAEVSPVFQGAASVMHRLLAVLGLAGLALAWRRPAPGLVLVALLGAVSLPYLASHIDVRYTVPPALAFAPLAGLAVAEVTRRLRSSRPPQSESSRQPRSDKGASPSVSPSRWSGSSLREEMPGWMAQSRRTLPAVLLAASLLLPLCGVAWLRYLAPGVSAWSLHLFHASVVCEVFVATAVALAWWLANGRQTRWFVASGLAVGAFLAAVYGTQALYDGDWHQWSVVLQPGQAVRQTLVLPTGWQVPPGGRAEMLVYLDATPNADPVISVNGTEVRHLGAGLTNAGPLRFWSQIMVAARNKGLSRSDVPQWVAVPVDAALLGPGPITLEVALPPAASGAGAVGASVRLWGDEASRPTGRIYDGPALYYRIQGANEAFHKFMATGEYAIWRWQTLNSLAAQPARRSNDGDWRSDDLSDAPGRQLGEYRLHLLVYGPNNDLVGAY